LRLAAFTDADWAVLRSDRSFVAKATTVVERCHKLALTVPSETTVRELVSMLAVVHVPEASSQQLFGMVSELKAIGSLQRTPPRALRQLAS